MSYFGEHLKSLRKAKTITQKQLAEHIGDYFDVSLDYLVGRSDEPNRY